jgi:hypothetical protein
MQYDTESQITKTKLQRKQNYYTTKLFPSSKRETNPKVSSQTCKLGLVKGFGKDICELVSGVNMAQVNIPFLIVVSQEVEADLYMFGF